MQVEQATCGITTHRYHHSQAITTNACTKGACGMTADAWRVCMSTGSAQLEAAMNENIPEEVYGLDCENKGAVPGAVEALKEWTCLKSAPHKVCVCVCVCVCVPHFLWAQG